MDLARLALSLSLSYLVGQHVAPSLRLPGITASLLTGCLCGPFALGLLDGSARQAQLLAPLLSLSLFFICFSAGAELHLPQLLPQLLRIVHSSLAISAASLAGLGLALLGATAPGTGLLAPAVEQQPLPCRQSLALLVAATLLTASPGAALAVVREARASGPFTTLMLGTTMLLDVVAMAAFAMARALMQATCSSSSGGHHTHSLLHALAALAASLAVGAAAGLGLGLALQHRRPAPAHLRALLALCAAAAAALLLLAALGSESLDASLTSLEPLLVSLTAGAVACNAGAGAEGEAAPGAAAQAAEGLAVVGGAAAAGAGAGAGAVAAAAVPAAEQPAAGLPSALSAASPLVFLLFFTATGATLDLATLASCGLFALLFSTLRAGCLALGVWLALPPLAAEGSSSSASSSASSSSASSSAAQALPLTLALVTQAGLSIGLAGELGRHFPGWGKDVETHVISAVLVNQGLGPYLCAYALRLVGEGGAASSSSSSGRGLGRGSEGEAAEA